MTLPSISRPTGSLAPIRTLRLRRRLPVVLLAILLVNQVFNPARNLGRGDAGAGSDVGDGLPLGQATARPPARRAVAARHVDSGRRPARARRLRSRTTPPFPRWRWKLSITRTCPAITRTGWRRWMCAARSPTTARDAASGAACSPWDRGNCAAATRWASFRCAWSIPKQRSILIYPRAMVLPDLQLPRGDAAGAARTHRPSRQYTTTVASVRPYVAGDPLRAIHWRQTAHHGEFMVKEFDLEPSGDLWIALDLEAGCPARRGCAQHTGVRRHADGFAGDSDAGRKPAGRAGRAGAC